MSEWKEYKIDEIAEILNHRRIPLNSQEREKRKGIYPYYGASGIIDFVDDFLFEGEHVLISEDGENLRSRTTPIAFKANGKFWVNNHAHIVKGRKPFLNDWIIYYFKNLDINSYITGAVQPKLNKENLLSIPIYLPNFENAEQIAEILSSLDDKIELNNAINKNLEDLAQALFKQWFVDFEFPNENGEPYKSSGGEMVESELGEIPKGWRIGKLEEVIEIKYGKDHKHLEDGQIPVYGSGGIMRYVNKAIYERQSILIPRKGTLSNLFYITVPFWSVDTMFYTIIKTDYQAKYLYLTLKALDLASMNVGSAVPSMTTKVLNNLEIILPSNYLLKQFNDVMSSIFDNIEVNKKENNLLSILRDTLLPKLISGELEVNEALLQTEKAM
jgi:type I restriction enzyme S subunit